jgi:hypothetical protein
MGQDRPALNWPAAGPGRRVGADSTLRVLRERADMVLIHYRGRYFAVPVQLGPVDPTALDRDDALPPGTLVADSEMALEREIDFVARWANSRGQFDGHQPRRDVAPFRAGSALGEPESSLIADDHVLMRDRGTVYAVPASDLAAIAGSKPEEVRVISAVSDGALMATLGPINDYFVFFLDHVFYAVPLMVLQTASRGGPLQGLPLHEQPGTLTSSSYPDLLRMIGAGRERRLVTGAAAHSTSEIASGKPSVVRSLLGYNIIAYEGWFYGVPDALGTVDLTETDALSLPGVIADVAQIAVEQEIHDRTAQSAGAAGPKDPYVPT